MTNPAQERHMSKLTTEEVRALRWLSKQTSLMWGGVYDRNAAGDGEVMRLLTLGLIEGVEQEIHVGKSVFKGGYRITPAGRAHLANGDEGNE